MPAYLQKAIIKGLTAMGFGALVDPSGYWVRYDPMKDWMVDKKLDSMLLVMNAALEEQKSSTVITKDTLTKMIAAEGMTSVQARIKNQRAGQGSYGKTIAGSAYMSESTAALLESEVNLALAQFGDATIRITVTIIIPLTTELKLKHGKLKHVKLLRSMT